MARGLQKKTKQLNLIPADQATGTVTGTGVDLGVGADRVMALCSIGDFTAGTDPAVNFKLQDSADNSVWADLGSATGAQTVADTLHVIEAGPCRRYVRAVATVTGTPNNVEVCAIGVASGIRVAGSVTGI